MKRWLCLALLVCRVRAADTAYVYGTVTVVRDGPVLAGVVCSTHACGGIIYKGKDTTDDRGQYLLKYSLGASYVNYELRATGYKLSPYLCGFSNLQPYQLQDVVADTIKNTVRGYVRYGSGEGVADVSITVSSSQTVYVCRWITNPDGSRSYSCIDSVVQRDTVVTTYPDPVKGFYRCGMYVHYWGTYTFTPSKPGCRFVPANRVYTKMLGNDTAAHFLCIDTTVTDVWQFRQPLRIFDHSRQEHRPYGLDGRIGFHNVYIISKSVQLNLEKR